MRFQPLRDVYDVARVPRAQAGYRAIPSSGSLLTSTESNSHALDRSGSELSRVLPPWLESRPFRIAAVKRDYRRGGPTRSTIPAYLDVTSRELRRALQVIGGLLQCRDGFRSGCEEESAKDKASQCDEVTKDRGANNLLDGGVQSASLEEHYSHECPAEQGAGTGQKDSAPMLAVQESHYCTARGPAEKQKRDPRKPRK
jgi:hypothetical protein